MKTKPTIAYKGFDKNMQCRGYQFEVGETYKHDGSVSVCESGFHACENPFDVWSYYGPFESRFAQVKISGKQKTHDGDSKIASAKIKIEDELLLPEFVNLAVNWIIHKCKTNIKSGDSARIGSSFLSCLCGSEQSEHP